MSGRRVLLVWADYPPWYHFAYLQPLMPIAGFSGHLVGGRYAA